MKTTKNLLHFAAVSAVVGWATEQDNGEATRGEARERIGAIDWDALADGKANNPANRY